MTGLPWLYGELGAVVDGPEMLDASGLELGVRVGLVRHEIVRVGFADSCLE